jgi:hypothetical protein
MKNFILLFVLIINTLFADARVTEKTYTFRDYTLSKTSNYDLIQFEGLTLTGKAGEPTLPYQSIRLALPPGEEIDRIEIITGELKEVPGAYQLYPVQYSHALSDNNVSSFYRKQEVYQSASPYPSSQYGTFSTEFLKGTGIGMTTVTPVVYLPKEGKIRYYQSITVRMYSKPTDRARRATENYSINARSLTSIEKFVQNPSVINNYLQSETSVNHFGILIITGHDYFGSFQPLVNLYLRRGFRSILADVDSISSTVTGQDLPEKIRNYIIQAYQAYGIEYVVLGGDIDIIPYRGLYCHVQSSSVYEDWDIPSDLYYSALDGTWDNNNNQVWGEIGEDDLLPEVAIGRMPFSNPQEAATMINKSIAYQNTPVTQELNRVLLLGEQLLDVPLTWGGDYLDLLIGHKIDNGYTTDGIYTTSDIETLYDRDLPQPWNVNQLLASLNEGKPVVYHSGHASSYYNMRMFAWTLNEGDFEGMNGTDHNFCVVYSHGCYSGSFDEEDCIAEEFLKLNHFAVEYVGNSRYGWFNEGSTEGPSEHLNREFVNALYHNEDYRIGEIHQQSRINSSSWVNAPGQWEEGALRWCYYDCNVLGDPVLGIWTDIPVPVQVSCSPSIQAYSSQMTVSVQDNIGAVEGVTCAFVSGNTLHGAAVTDNNGIAVIQFDIAPTVPGQGEVVVSGYNRLATAVPVTISGSVGIISTEKEFNFVLSPNPCKNTLTLTYESENISVSLFSINSNNIHKEIYKGSAGNNTLILNSLIQNISAGMYYLKVETNSHVKTFKLIKN